jgi:hypothetical protein
MWHLQMWARLPKSPMEFHLQNCSFFTQPWWMTCLSRALNQVSWYHLTLPPEQVDQSTCFLHSISPTWTKCPFLDKSIILWNLCDWLNLDQVLPPGPINCGQRLSLHEHGRSYVNCRGDMLFKLVGCWADRACDSLDSKYSYNEWDSAWHGLNSVPTKFKCQSPNPQFDGIRRRGLWEVIRFKWVIKVDQTITMGPDYNKIPGIVNLWGGKVYFGPEFQRFQSQVGWLHCFWACGKEIMLWYGACGRTSCSHPGGQEVKKKKLRAPQMT